MICLVAKLKDIIKLDRSFIITNKVLIYERFLYIKECTIAVRNNFLKKIFDLYYYENIPEELIVKIDKL